MVTTEVTQDQVMHRELAKATDEDSTAPYCKFLGGSNHTRGELLARSKAVASGLQELGVGKGDRVAILLSNRAEFLEVWFAISLLGAIGVPLNTALRGDVLLRMVSTTEPTVVVAETAFMDNLRTAKSALNASDLVLLDSNDTVSDQGDWSFARAQYDYQDLLSDTPVKPAEVEPSDPFVIMYTSGTTGPSKGVIWSHRTALRIAGGAAHYLSYDQSDTVFTALPMFHGNGMMLAIVGALIARAQVVVSPRFSASAFWQEINETGATVVNIVGAMAQMLTRQEPSEQESTHNLRLALVIPSPPGKEYFAFEERFNVRITEAYGITDVGMLLYAPPGEQRPGSCGKPAEGWECRLVDEADVPIDGPGEVGELVARPQEPWLAPLGYWGMAEATVRAWRNLWLHTGDRLYRDEDGWYYFVDRVKDAIRRRGENISSFEVEQVLQTHEAVSEVAVYGVPSELQEEEVMAAIVFESSELPPFDELLDYCSERLPYFAVPRYIRRVEELPKTQTGKVTKPNLRDEGVTEDTWDREEANYELAR